MAPADSVASDPGCVKTRNMRVLRYLFLGDPELDSDEQTRRLKNLNKVVYLLMIIALILFFIEAWRS
jgi:hypothetical protein